MGNRLINIAHRRMADREQPVRRVRRPIHHPAAIGFEAGDIEIVVKAAERAAAEADRLVDAIKVHVGEALGRIISVALIGQPANHLEILAGASGLIVDHHHRAAIALEADIVAIIAVFDNRRLGLLRFGQIILPHVMRGIDMNIGVENRPPGPVLLGSTAEQWIRFAHSLSPGIKFTISNSSSQ